MKYFNLTSATLAVGLLLSGCASAGNEKMRHETPQTVDQKIVDNVTTKAQVQKIYGTPNSTNFTDSGMEIWKYKFVRATAKGINFVPVANMFSQGKNTKTKELVILFDNNSVVKKHTFLDTKGEVNAGIGG